MKANVCEATDARPLINGGTKVFKNLFGSACKALHTVEDIVGTVESCSAAWTAAGADADADLGCACALVQDAGQAGASESGAFGDAVNSFCGDSGSVSNLKACRNSDDDEQSGKDCIMAIAEYGANKYFCNSS